MISQQKVKVLPWEAIFVVKTSCLKHSCYAIISLTLRKSTSRDINERPAQERRKWLTESRNLSEELYWFISSESQSSYDYQKIFTQINFFLQGSKTVSDIRTDLSKEVNSSLDKKPSPLISCIENRSLDFSSGVPGFSSQKHQTSNS